MEKPAASNHFPDNKLADYCNKIGREHIISITSCFGEQYGEHFYTIVYDTPDLVLADC